VIRPYTPIGDFYKSLFDGKRAQKIPVTIATDCPNRRGLNGMQTCIFCDEWGSSAYPEQRSQLLQTQISDKLSTLKLKYKNSVFLAYFQAYTNTFMGTKRLKESFDCALSFTEMRGIIIGTRPDCISPAVLNLWNEYTPKTYVGVELGVQTFFDDDLEFLKRGHSAQASIDAVKLIKSKTNVDLGIHLMFGLPYETDDRIVEMAKIISDLPIDNVKLHNLHVLKNTPLEKIFESGFFKPIELEAYTKRVILFLKHLDPRVRIQRLAALSSRWEELVSPEWTKHKMKNTQAIIDSMTLEKAFQGQNFRPNNAV
jgi:radical SAM protein (TIGR01212 family)